MSTPIDPSLRVSVGNDEPMESVGRSGDGFIRCSDGHARWGIFGAAGVVFVHRALGEPPRVLLQQRSLWSHEGGTWSCPGGALDEGEDAIEGALREAFEEIGWVPPHRVVGQYVFVPATDWTYTTSVIEVDRRFGDTLSYETEGIDWLYTEEVELRPLHAGFAAAWPHVRAIVDALPPVSEPVEFNTVKEG